jgi:hypothetical protein
VLDLAAATLRLANLRLKQALKVGPVLARVGDMVSQTGQPLQRVHGLAVPPQEGIHARAIQDGLLAVEIHEFLEGERRADHVAGHILDGLLVLERDRLSDMRREARMAPRGGAVYHTPRSYR